MKKTRMVGTALKGVPPNLPLQRLTCMTVLSAAAVAEAWEDQPHDPF